MLKSHLFKILESDMTTVFHTRLYGRFIEIKSTLRRKELHRSKKGLQILLKAVLAIETL